MKKVLVALLILTVIAGIGGTGYFGYRYVTATSEKDILIKQNGELQSAIDAIGPVSFAYTVKADVFAGKEIKEDDLVEQTIPVSSINENYITDKKELVGKYYKVDIKPGTSITKDVVMKDPMKETTYERDLSFPFLPLGIKTGDYVDIRVVLPYGEEFIVMEHERVEKVSLETNTIKLRLTEAQLALWTSALADNALWHTKGLSLYVTKYVEPGIHKPALPFYPVRQEMENVVTLNPNIVDKTECINSKLRKEIDKKLAAVSDEDGSASSAGKTEEAASINQAKETYLTGEETDMNEENKEDNASKGETVNKKDPTIQDEINNLEGVDDNEKDENISLDSMDSDGNTANVTKPEKDKAAGEDLYDDEDLIQ